MDMDLFPLESLVAISAFWMAVILLFIILVWRMRTKKSQDGEQPTSEPGRVIQIFYIDGSQGISGQSGNILNKILTRLEDQPPTYDEATITPEANVSSPRLEILGEQSTSSNVEGEPHPNPNRTEPVEDIVIVVERNS